MQRAHCVLNASATSACAQWRAPGSAAAPSTSSGRGQGLMTSLTARPRSRCTTQPSARANARDGPLPTSHTRAPSRTTSRFETRPRLAASASPRAPRTHQTLATPSLTGSSVGADTPQAHVATLHHSRHSATGIPCFSLEHSTCGSACRCPAARGMCLAPKRFMGNNDKPTPRTARALRMHEACTS